MAQKKLIPPSLRKKMLTSTASLGPKAASARKKPRATHISSPSQPFLTSRESVPEALRQPNPSPIPLATLAARLEVEQRRLLPLIEHGYLHLVSSDPPVVYEPPPAAVEWLREMFTPLTMRPVVTLEMVAHMENIRPSDVRTLCASYGIPIRVDPVFGELFTLGTFYRFHQQMFYYREPSRFDRQAMLVALVESVAIERRGHVKRKLATPTYSTRVEREIKRIVKLPEPAKTDASLRLWESFEDAMEIAKVVSQQKGYRVPPRFDGLKKVAKRLMVHEKPPTVDGSR